jgi:lactam utilization protein B
VSHGAYLSKLSASENAELAELADELRTLTPVDSPSIELAVQTLASLIWRQRRLLAFLAEHGLIRGRSDRTQLQPAVEALAVIDRQIITTMAALSMLPKQAAELGLSLVKLEAQRRFDRSRQGRKGRARPSVEQERDLRGRVRRCVTRFSNAPPSNS